MKIFNNLLLILSICYISKISGSPYLNDKDEKKENKNYVTLVHHDKYKPSFKRNVNYKNEKFIREPIPTLTITFKPNTPTTTTKVTKVTSNTNKHSRAYYKSINNRKIYRKSFFAPTMTKVGNTVKPTFASYIYDTDISNCIGNGDCHDMSIPELIVDHLKDKTAFRPKEQFYHKTLSIKPVCKNGYCKTPVATVLPCLHGNCKLLKEKEENIEEYVGVKEGEINDDASEMEAAEEH
ncbi:hypothetical protein PIROE2DRAFT_16261 [Piromyces sp. E2]|nr:hypothetical protein PIROE2DRAFT_16261 [Piromyces sp. E2]|eukprot:OUM58450.1 hypothetical protein PIROE2DRAFT_16261 [Piromyces sp. E2]